MFLNLSPDFPNDESLPVCPPGSMEVDGVCVGVGNPEIINFLKREAAKNQGVNPALILAVAAAFFFAG